MLKSRLASSSRLVDQRLHRRVQPIALPELNRKAFAQGSGKYTRRIEVLQDVQDCRDALGTLAKTHGDFAEIGPQVAGLVEVIGKHRGDQAVARLGKGEGDLLAQMVANADLARDEIVEVVTLSRFRAAAGHRLPLAEQFRSVRPGGGALVGKCAVEIGIEAVVQAVAVARLVPFAVERSAGAAFVARIAVGLRARLSVVIAAGSRLADRLAFVRRHLEQRILLHLL